MIFKITNHKIHPLKSSWTPKELEVQNFILPSNSDDRTLHPSVFGEELLLIKNEVRTKEKKRADILALDRMGNGVIIELKRENGNLGIETQALQYLAGFSSYKGRQFLTHFSGSKDSVKEEDVLGFLGGSARIEDINRRSRIILIARGFDPSLFSMGEWLSNSGVAFRCIEYTPFQIDNDQFISFSVKFNRTPTSLYPLIFENQMRSPAYFWHNIGRRDNDWWSLLVKDKLITAGFDNQPGDQGERLLRGYTSGDTIIAYASGFGAIGWGIIDDTRPYYLAEASKDDFLKGHHLHRRGIIWHAVAEKLEDGLRANYVRDKLAIYHPMVGTYSI